MLQIERRLLFGAWDWALHNHKCCKQYFFDGNDQVCTTLGRGRCRLRSSCNDVCATIFLTSTGMVVSLASGCPQLMNWHKYMSFFELLLLLLLTFFERETDTYTRHGLLECRIGTSKVTSKSQEKRMQSLWTHCPVIPRKRENGEGIDAKIS